MILTRPAVRRAAAASYLGALLSLTGCAKGILVDDDVVSADATSDTRHDGSLADGGVPDGATPDVLPGADVPAPLDGDARCHTDADCASTAATPVCDTSSGACVECTTAADHCAAGTYCNVDHCVAGCRADADCTGATAHCDTATHTCLGCVHDADCALGTVCAAGACVPGCNAGHGCAGSAACCGSACVDTQTDTTNCGSCGHACPASNTCTAGACIPPCSAGLTDCGGGVCANLASDNAHCGACATACAAGQVCAAGACGAPAPANDTCAAATALALTGSTVTVTGSTDGAHNESGCGSGGDVYYSFTLTRREVVYADTFGSGFDTRLAIGSTCAVSTSCVDDACGVLQSQLAVVLDAGTYYLAVSGYSGTGAFTLHVQQLPAGNGPVNAISSGASTTASGSTSGTGTVNGSCNSGSAPENTYYWTTCPSFAGGTATATFCASGGTASYDSVLYIQHGDGAAAACNDDSCGLQSSVTSSLNAGAALHAIYVDGYSSNAGSYTLAYTTP